MRPPARLAAAAPASAQGPAEVRQLVLGSTTSVENSGLLGHVLPRFATLTGIEVRVVAQGTGQQLFRPSKAGP